MATSDQADVYWDYVCMYVCAIIMYNNKLSFYSKFADFKIALWAHTYSASTHGSVVLSSESRAMCYSSTFAIQQAWVQKSVNFNGEEKSSENNSEGGEERYSQERSEGSPKMMYTICICVREILLYGIRCRNNYAGFECACANCTFSRRAHNSDISHFRTAKFALG